MSARTRKVPVTIADGTSLSGAAYLGGECVVGIVTPAGWTTAAISMQASMDGGTTYNVIWDDTSDAEWSVAAVVASRHLAVDPKLTAGATHVKVQSGTSGATVNQAGGDQLEVMTRPID